MRRSDPSSAAKAGSRLRPYPCYPLFLDRRLIGFQLALSRGLRCSVGVRFGLRNTRQSIGSIHADHFIGPMSLRRTRHTFPGWFTATSLASSSNSSTLRTLASPWLARKVHRWFRRASPTLHESEKPLFPAASRGGRYWARSSLQTSIFLHAIRHPSGTDSHESHDLVHERLHRQRHGRRRRLRRLAWPHVVLHTLIVTPTSTPRIRLLLHGPAAKITD
jgi:hypothetical protein